MTTQTPRRSGVAAAAHAGRANVTLPRSSCVALLALLAGFFLSPLLQAQGVTLGTATPFAVLGGSAISSTGPTVVTGDLGIHPSNVSSVTGFTFSTPPGPAQVVGATHFADAVALTAQNDTTTAYNTLAGLPCSATISADLGGLTLPAGVYCAGSSMGLTGTLTLDAQGDPDAVFVFQVGSQLTTASNARVAVINGGQSCNVFWQVGSSATLGTGTQFLGNLIALSSISLNTASRNDGRLLARTGAVTLDNAAITVCALAPPGVSLPPMVSKAFAPPTIVQSGVSTLTITLSNPDSAVSTLTSAFIDTLPAGVVLATPPSAATTCAGSGSILAAAGGSSIGLSAGYAIPAAGSCVLTVNVTAAASGTYVNTVPAGALVTSTGSNSDPTSATLIVTPTVPPPLVPPQVVKSFTPATILAGATSVLTINLVNPSSSPSTLTAALTDFLPPGLVIATPPASSTTCSGGILVAAPGGSTVTIPAGISIPANGACSFRVSVTAAQAGAFVNTIPAGALITNTGSNIPPTTDTLTVTPPAVVPPPPTGQPVLPIPTLGTWALLLLVLLMVVGAATRSRLR